MTSCRIEQGSDRGSADPTTVSGALIGFAVMGWMAVLAQRWLLPQWIADEQPPDSTLVWLAVVLTAVPVVIGCTFAAMVCWETVRSWRVRLAVKWAGVQRNRQDAATSMGTAWQVSHSLLQFAEEQGDERLASEAAFDLRRDTRGEKSRRKLSRARSMGVRRLGGGPVTMWRFPNEGQVIQPAPLPVNEPLWRLLTLETAEVGSQDERGGLARQNRALPLDVVERLAGDQDPYVRRGIAKRVDLPDHIAAALAADPDPWVRNGCLERQQYLPIGS